jgi:5-methylcytosine-specific restriction enzyme A
MMAVHPSARNLAKDVVRQVLPKVQPRRPRESKSPKRRYTGASPVVLLLVKTRSGGRCERCAWSVPVDAEVHHRVPRGMGGSKDPRINLPSNLVNLCAACHRWAESYRSAAYRDGWLVHRTAEPNATPIESKLHGYVLFADDGGVDQVERLAGGAVEGTAS